MKYQRTENKASRGPPGCLLLCYLCVSVLSASRGCWQLELELVVSCHTQTHWAIHHPTRFKSYLNTRV